MNEIIGTQTKYILVQTNTTEGAQNAQQAMFYNEYNNSITPSGDVNQGTKFDDLATVEELANIQNMMATLFKKPFSYSVVQEVIERTVVK